MIQSIFSKFNLVLFGFFVILTSSCEEQKDRKEVSVEELPTQTSDLNSYAKQHIEDALRIPATEKYTLSIHKENLDGDDKQDAIILVLDTLRIDNS